MEDINPWYITGFCDGEAAFTYSRAGGTFGMYFGLRQRADNEELIQRIWEYFHYVGNIYYGRAAEPTRNSGYTKSSVYYRVTKADDLTIILDHFDKYPLQSAKKLEAYKIWREMVIYKIKNFRNINYDDLRPMAVKLSSLNSKSRAFKIHTRTWRKS